MKIIQLKSSIEHGQRFSVADRDGVATYDRVVSAWIEDREFRMAFNAALAAVPYQAFRWETPVLTDETRTQAFEFVVIDSPGLDRPADSSAFDKYLVGDKPVVVFENLGKDATLVVPQKLGEDSAYNHLASFVRSAPVTQTDSFWAAVGQTIANHISDQPVWVSTAGAGVPWFHLRLDDRPKYYAYQPYAEFI